LKQSAGAGIAAFGVSAWAATDAEVGRINLKRNP
jgi:hypothetical protein